MLLVLSLLVSGCSEPRLGDDSEGDDGVVFKLPHDERRVDYQGPLRQERVLNASSAAPVFAVEPPCAEPVDLEPVAGVVAVLDADPGVAVPAVESVFGLAVSNVQEAHRQVGPPGAVEWLERSWEGTVDGGTVLAHRYERKEGGPWEPYLELEVQAAWTEGVDRAWVDAMTESLDLGGVTLSWQELHGATERRWRAEAWFEGMGVPDARAQVAVDLDTGTLRVVLAGVVQAPLGPASVSESEASATARAYMTCLDLPWDEDMAHGTRSTALVRDGRVAYGVYYPNASCLDERRIVVDAWTGDVLGVDVAQSCIL